MPADVPDLNNPAATLEFAVGPTSAHLRPVRPDALPTLHGLRYDSTHSFVLKKAHFSQDDWRLFDAESGRRIYNAHHPGKNPYGSLDPLGMVTPDTAEFASLFDVSGHGGGFKIRGKSRTMHGRQVVKTLDDRKVMNVAKRSKIKTMSLRKSYKINEGDHKHSHSLFIVQCDALGRTIQFHRTQGNKELVALAWKPAKTLALNVALGVGSEMQFDVAAGVDCSFMVAALFGVLQVGNSLVKDAVGSFIVAPLQDEAVDAALDGELGDKVMDGLEAVGLDDEAEEIGGGAIDAIAEALGGVAGFFADAFDGDGE